jgi:hypothetical protein
LQVAANAFPIIHELIDTTRARFSQDFPQLEWRSTTIDFEKLPAGLHQRRDGWQCMPISQPESSLAQRSDFPASL